MDFNLITGITAILIGLVVGLLTGMFGVGGGFLMTPALMVLLGVPGPIAVGTGLACILPTSSFAIFKRRGSNTIDFKLALTICAGSLFGIVAGSALLEYLKDVPQIIIFGRQQDVAQYVLLCLFVLLLVSIAAYLIFDHKKSGGKSPKKRVGLLMGLKLPPRIHFESLDEPKLSIWGLLLLGLGIGFLTGMLGIGGGVVLLPCLIYLVGQRTIKAAGTSLMLVWVSSLVAVIMKSGAGDIDYILALELSAGSIIGTLAGTKIGLKLAGAKLRMYFVYVIFAAILMVGYKLYAITFSG